VANVLSQIAGILIGALAAALLPELLAATLGPMTSIMTRELNDLLATEFGEDDTVLGNRAWVFTARELQQLLRPHGTPRLAGRDPSVFVGYARLWLTRDITWLAGLVSHSLKHAFTIQGVANSACAETLDLKSRPVSAIE
jgi:hypothetical protein